MSEIEDLLLASARARVAGELEQMAITTPPLKITSDYTSAPIAVDAIRATFALYQMKTYKDVVRLRELIFQRVEAAGPANDHHLQEQRTRVLALRDELIRRRATGWR